MTHNFPPGDQIYIFEYVIHMIAILIECDNQRNLGGSCERDLITIRNQLIGLYGADGIEIYCLTNSSNYFTGRGVGNVMTNTITNFKQLLQKVSHRLYIHISGHGYQGVDRRHNELDGRCEQISLSSGVMTDYMFYDCLKQSVDRTCMIRITVDTCHSGTFSNFAYQVTDRLIPASIRPVAYFTNAYSLSACSDSQSDSCDIGDHGFGGGLTCHLVDSDNLSEFLNGRPVKVRDRLIPILKLLRQDPVLLVDSRRDDSMTD